MYVKRKIGEQRKLLNEMLALTFQDNHSQQEHFSICCVLPVLFLCVHCFVNYNHVAHVFLFPTFFFHSALQCEAFSVV